MIPIPLLKACRRFPFVSASLLVLLLAVGCASAAPEASPQTSNSVLPDEVPSVQVADTARVITLGDIDADEPPKKINRLKPVADYLKAHLQGSAWYDGFGVGRSESTPASAASV